MPGSESGLVYTSAPLLTKGPCSMANKEAGVSGKVVLKIPDLSTNGGKSGGSPGCVPKNGPK